MRIRAIAVGTKVRYSNGRVIVDSRIPSFIEVARDCFAEAELVPQTTRLAVQPFPSVVSPDRDAVIDFARALEAAGSEAGFGYMSMGPVAPESLDYVPYLTEAILNTASVFGTVITGDQCWGVSLPSVAAASGVIAALGRRSDQGFGNLRFAALANCPPDIPFFPAGYHHGDQSSFGIAWEAADLAVDAFSTAGTIVEAQQRLLAMIEREGARVARLAKDLAERQEISFNGIDLSLAPFPEEARSIGAAFERLGVDVFGAPGTLFIASLITGVLQQARVPKTGYSGLMMPVLEDLVLGERAAQCTYTVNDLLLYSAVCGLGLDVVPLPGEIGIDELRGLLLDMTTLAVRLDKPLSARLLPLPGKRPGDPTGFSFSYFANGAVMPVKGYGASRLFAREGL